MMVKQGQQKGPIKAGRIFKVRVLNDESIRWLYTQRVKLHLKNTKENEIDIEKEWENLQNIKISSKWKSRNNKETKYGELFKNMGWPNKTINKNKEKIIQKRLNSKKLEDRLVYIRNTALAKREVRRRQRLSWDKFATNLEHEIYRTQTNV